VRIVFTAGFAVLKPRLIVVVVVISVVFVTDVILVTNVVHVAIATEACG